MIAVEAWTNWRWQGMPDVQEARVSVALPLPRQGTDARAAAERRAQPRRDRCPSTAPGPSRTGRAASTRTQPRHLPKINFLMLMRDERLATLRSPVRRRDRDADHPARRQAGRPRPADDPARPAADRAVHRRLHEGGAARGPQDRARAGPQLLRRRGQVRAHRQSGERARAGAHPGPSRRSAALPRQPLPRGRASPGPSSAGWARRSRLARCGSRCSRAPSGARRPTSIRPRASATWPFRPISRAPGATRTSASTPRSPWAARSRWEAPVGVPQ